MSQKIPEKLDYSLPEEIDKQVRSALPDLFSGAYKNVLYIGANYLRQHFLDDFVRDYDRVVILEIFEKNVKYLADKFSGTDVQIIQGDVRNAAKVVNERFDVCFFYHGPEHLQKDETGKVLETLEGITKKLVVLGMPHGHYAQGAEYGNQHESHQWAIYPKDMEEFGYKSDTLGDADDTLSNMISWKHL